MKNNKDRKLFSNLSKLIILFEIVSFLIGVLLTIKIQVPEISVQNNSQIVFKFLNIFMLNFWIVFLMWLLGKYKGLFLINFFIAFLKCLILGITFGINIKSGNVFSYLKYFIIDILVYLPLLFFEIYQNIQYNFYDNVKRINYDLLIIIYTIWCILYSMLCSIIGSYL